MRSSRNPKIGHFICYLTRCCLGITLLCLSLLAIGALIPRKWSYSVKKNCDVTICVSHSGIHSDIIVPVRNDIFDWHQHLSIHDIGVDAAQNYKYLSFGWGDRDFYMLTPTLSDLDPRLTFRALFIPTPSVMYVKGYQNIPNFLTVKCVKVSREKYMGITQFIQASFQVSATGEKVRLGNGHTSNAGFYAAVGKYSLLRTCNSWTAEGLRTGDINTPVWDGLPSAILWHLRSGCQDDGLRSLDISTVPRYPSIRTR